MNTLTELEERAGGVEPARRLLGLSRSSYYDMRANRASIPLYIHASVRAHLALNRRQFKEVTEQ